MSIKALLATLLATAAATVSFAQTPRSGYVGSLTMAFTISYATNKETVVSTNTSTAYKSLQESPVTRAKYGNKEFIKDLISSGFLNPSTSAADWSLKMLVIYDGPVEIYATHKNGTIVYVGNAIGDSGGAIGVGSKDAFFNGGSTSISAKRVNFNTVEQTTAEFIDGQASVELALNPTSQTHATLHGLFTQNLTATLKEVFTTDTQTTTMKIKTIGFTNLVGGANLLDDDRGDMVMTGSMQATGFKLVADVDIYRDTRF